jgi:hypothetical protein
MIVSKKNCATKGNKTALKTAPQCQTSRTYRLTAILLAALCSSSPGLSLSGSDEKLARILSNILAQLEAARLSLKFPGATVGFVLPDGRSASASIGVADLETGVPLKPSIDCWLEASVKPLSLLKPCCWCRSAGWRSTTRSSAGWVVKDGLLSYLMRMTSACGCCSITPAAFRITRIAAALSTLP